MPPRQVFITGATGYIGRALIPELLARGHAVRALVRRGSEARLPAGAQRIVGDALVAASFQQQIPPSDTLVQLVGVSHPSPTKADQFRAVDQISIQQSVYAAKHTGIRHFIYLSVAQPAPIMQNYIAVRAEGESILKASGIPATILRPWYVLGPRRWWPLALQPLYWLAGLLPATREGARRLGLVTLPQMVGALVRAVEDPSAGVRVWEVPEIRRGGALDAR